MKKKHAISITIIMLLLLALIPSNSCAIPRGNPMRADYDDSFTYGIVDDNQDPDVPSGDPPYLPFPGEIIENPPMFQNFHIPKRQPHHHEFSVKSQNDLIVDILLQLNESLYLGYLEDIVSFGPRRTGTPSCQQAGEYIYTQFKAMGLEAQYHNWTYGGYSSSNIEGTLVGENETSDEIYIICAHYDTVSGSPGADDDGSGTAAVLVAADIFSKYAVNHTVRFVAFSGEEQGLLGSYEYAREASQNGDNIIGVLNGDMIGFAISTYDGNNIKIYENTESHWLTLFTEEISELYDEYIELNIIPSGSSGGSDHYSFWQWGYDSIFYHEYNFNDYYHSSQDTIENMNITYTTKSSRLMIGTLAALAQAVVPSEPPYLPSITGPKTGIEEEEYEFTFVTTDPEGDDVYYYVDWGDNTYSEWFGPYNSGEEATATHTWTLEGDYEIRAKAKDIYDVESDWSIPFPITILGGPEIDVHSIKGGFYKVSSTIKNVGGLEATDVNWKIRLKGGAIIGKETTGMVTIPAGEEKTVTSKLIIGFGPTTVTVSAEIPESWDKLSLGGRIFLFYIYVRPGGGI